MRISDWSSDVCSSDLLGFSQKPDGLRAAKSRGWVGAFQVDVWRRWIVDRPLACDPIGQRLTTLNRKPDMAILVGTPCRIPCTLPSVIVLTRYISSITAVRRGICWADDPPARLAWPPKA